MEESIKKAFELMQQDLEANNPFKFEKEKE